MIVAGAQTEANSSYPVLVAGWLYHFQVTFSGLGYPPLLHISSAFSKPTDHSAVAGEMVASGGTDTEKIMQEHCEYELNTPKKKKKSEIHPKQKKKEAT